MAGSVRIGALRYDVIADTSKFEKPMKATRRELGDAQRAFNATRTPAERYAESLRKLDSMYKKGLIDSATYRRSLAKEQAAYKQATKETNRYQRALGTLQGKLGGFAGVFAGMAGIHMVTGNIRAAFTDIDEIAKTSRKLGMATEDLIAFQLAGAELAGMQDNTVNMAMQRFTRRLAEAAHGTGEAKAAIEELGLSAQNLNAAGTRAAFDEIANAMLLVENPADRLRIAFKLFDSEGAAMVNVMNEGAGAIDLFADKAQKLGLVFSDAEAAKVEAMNDAIGELKLSLGGLGREAAVVASEFRPLISALTEVLAASREIEDATGSKLAGMAFKNPYMGAGFAALKKLAPGQAELRKLEQTIEYREFQQRNQARFDAPGGGSTYSEAQNWDELIEQLRTQNETLKSIEQKTEPVEVL